MIKAIVVSLIDIGSCDPLDNMVDFKVPESVFPGTAPVKTEDVAKAIIESPIHCFNRRAYCLCVVHVDATGEEKEFWRFDGVVLDNLNQFLRDFDAKTMACLEDGGW